MRIKFGKSRDDGRIGHAVFVQSIDIVLVHYIQDKSKFAPVYVAGVQKMLLFAVAHHRKGDKGAYYNAQYHLKYLY